MKRLFDQNKPELMDVPQPVSAELERDLANLVSLNRFFGSHRLTLHYLSSWMVRGNTYRILDLATGAGDIPRVIVEWCRANGVNVRIDAVDAHPSTLEIARKGGEAYPEIEWIRGDALTYHSGNTYDIVCCSLALHHFSDGDAVALLKHCRELSHRYVLVSDLERSIPATIGIWLVTALIYRDRMTQYDARLSAARAFSWIELHDLAAAAGWTGYGQARFLFCRQAIWLSKLELGDIPVEVLPVADVFPCPG